MQCKNSMTLLKRISACLANRNFIEAETLCWWTKLAQLFFQGMRRKIFCSFRMFHHLKVVFRFAKIDKMTLSIQEPSLWFLFLTRNISKIENFLFFENRLYYHFIFLRFWLIFKKQFYILHTSNWRCSLLSAVIVEVAKKNGVPKK